MLLSPEELKQQTRDLWKNCFHESDDFLDIYFEDKYRPGRNITARPYGDVVAAAQLLPYRMTFYGNVLYTGYVSGLCVHPDFRRRGFLHKFCIRLIGICTVRAGRSVSSFPAVRICGVSMKIKTMAPIGHRPIVWKFPLLPAMIWMIA